MPANPVYPHAFEVGNEIIERILAGEITCGNQIQNPIQHLQGQMVDEQPGFKRIDIAHIAGTAVEGVIVGLEGLFDFLARLVEMMHLLAVEIEPVGLEDKGSDACTATKHLGNIDRVEHIQRHITEPTLAFFSPMLFFFASKGHGGILLVEPIDQIGCFMAGQFRIMVENHTVAIVVEGLAVDRTAAEIENVLIAAGTIGQLGSFTCAALERNNIAQA